MVDATRSLGVEVERAARAFDSAAATARARTEGAMEGKGSGGAKGDVSWSSEMETVERTLSATFASGDVAMTASVTSTSRSGWTPGVSRPLICRMRKSGALRLNALSPVKTRPPATRSTNSGLIPPVVKNRNQLSMTREKAQPECSRPSQTRFLKSAYASSM